MKESGMIARLAAAVVFLAMAAEPAVAADDASAAPLVEFARVLKHPLPVWPGMVDREALVILRFDVLSSGKTANIQLVEGGFHEQRFVNAAINAVKRYTFAPKRIDGTPVDTQGITQAFRFDLKLEPGITPDFRRELVKVGQLLDRKDYEGAHFHAEWMVAEKVKLGYEYAVLQAQLAETYSRLGQTSEAIFRAYKATQRTGKSPEFLQLLPSIPPNKASYYLLSREIVARLLELRMRALIKQGLYLEAMQSYYELAGLVELKQHDPRVVVARQVEAVIRGPDTLVGKVETGGASGWVQPLSRHSFTLDNIQGQVKGLVIGCTARERTAVEYKPAMEWKVPASWGVCAVHVATEPRTTFDFIEFPDSPATRSGP